MLLQIMQGRVSIESNDVFCTLITGTPCRHNDHNVEGITLWSMLGVALELYFGILYTMFYNILHYRIVILYAMIAKVIMIVSLCEPCTHPHMS